MFNSSTVANLAGQSHLRRTNSRLNQYPNHYDTINPLPIHHSSTDRHGVNQQNFETQLQQTLPQAPMTQFSLPSSSQHQHSTAHLDHLSATITNQDSSSDGLCIGGADSIGRFGLDSQLQQPYPQLSGPSDMISANFFQQYYHQNHHHTASNHSSTNQNSSHLYYNTNNNHHQHESQFNINSMATDFTNTTINGSVPNRLSNASQAVDANQAANLVMDTLSGFRYRQPYLDNIMNSTHDSTMDAGDNSISLSKTVAGNDNNDSTSLSNELKVYNHQSNGDTSNGSCSSGSKNNNNKSTSNKRARKPEKSSESPKRSFACPTCSKGFSEKFNMRRHMQIHSQSRPKYSCDECSKSFAWESNMRRHMQIHSQSRPMRAP